MFPEAECENTSLARSHLFLLDALIAKALAFSGEVTVTEGLGKVTHHPSQHLLSLISGENRRSAKTEEHGVVGQQWGHDGYLSVGACLRGLLEGKLTLAI